MKKPSINKKKPVRIHALAPSQRYGRKLGSSAGYQRGFADGRAQGLRDTIMPLALIITQSLNIPSLDILLLQPFNHLKSLGVYNYRLRTEDAVKPEDVDAVSTVIFLRSVEPSAYQVLEWAQERGKRIIYVIDDNFFEVPEVDGIYEYYSDPTRLEVFDKFLRNSHVIKTNSPYFADWIRMNYNPNVVCFPASVDFAWIEQDGKPERLDGQIVIGYQGTTKDVDFAPVVPAILQIANDYAGRVRFEFFGYMPQELIGMPWVSHVGYNFDYRTFARHFYQTTWDIGLAPLADNLFNNCKTNNKFREYASNWIPGIYSESPVYSSCVVHGDTGLLVPQTVEGWYEGMKELIEKAELRDRIRQLAGTYVRQHYTIDASAVHWRQQLLFV
jgi:hypothetical protein